MSRRSRRLTASLVCLTAAVLMLTPVADSSETGGPFYFQPAPTNECQGVTGCKARVGPWVVVPKQGVASFLTGCPTQNGYLIGGTDARVSSPSVRVWFDGALGAPIGRTGTTGAQLLFHAVSENGRVAAFQPILGCVALKPQNRVSTVAFFRFGGAIPGLPTPTFFLRAQTVPVRLYRSPGYTYKARYPARCPKSQTVTSSWGAVAFETVQPPGADILNSVLVHITPRRHAVFASIQQFSTAAIPPQALAQYGAVCQP
jgi:hypothetical protein